MRKPTMPIFLPGNFEKGDRTIGDIAVPRGYERIAVGTPAVEFHVLSNPLSPRLSPWFALDETAEVLYFSIFKYYKGELRYFE